VQVTEKPGLTTMRIVAEPWAPRTHELRDFLDRNDVPVVFAPPESPQGRELLSQAGQDGARLPVVVYFDGRVQLDPSNSEIAGAVGVRTRPDTDSYDIARSSCPAGRGSPGVLTRLRNQFALSTSGSGQLRSKHPGVGAYSRNIGFQDQPGTRKRDCLYRMIAIDRMMSVNDCEEVDVMSMTDRPAGQPEQPGPRRLTRSRTDRKIAGVCGGFAAYSGIDANIVRLVMIVLALLGGSGVVLYLVAWAIVPVEDAAEATDNGKH